jgi:Calcineurin-like phosphoesterase
VAIELLSKLKDRLTRSARLAAIPVGTIVYAIGDVHGRDDLLEDLLDQIVFHAQSTPAEHRVLVFLGDYVDRGWQSREVLERLASFNLDGFEAVFLKGNHEEALLSFLDDPHFLENWRQYGGLETLHAYGLKDLNFRADEDYLRNVHSEFVTALPAHHRAFLLGLPTKYELGGYLFVHAGVRPGVPLEMQQEHDLRWIRDEFLNSQQDFGKRIVHGHCPEEEPQVRPNRIGIDTGAYITGVLTAAVLTGTNVSFLQTRS